MSLPFGGTEGARAGSASARHDHPFWGDAWILLGLAIYVGFRILYFWKVASAQPLFGDEGFYYANAGIVVRVAHHLLTGRLTAGLGQAAQLVDRGWFLPGPSVVLAPVCAVTSSLPLARAYVGLLSSLWFLVGVRRLSVLFGLVPARIALLVVAIFPYHAAFTFRFWGDLLAAHGLVYLLTLLVDVQREAAQGKTDRSGPIRAGATILSILYLRPSLILLVPAILLFLFLFQLQAGTALQAAKRATPASVMILAIVAAGLSPWSYAVSRKFGGLFITSTSVDLNIIYAFGSRTWRPDNVDQQNPWVFIFQRIEAKAASSGKPFAAASREWRDAVIGSLTFRDYAAVVRGNLHLFFLRENDFLERFASRDPETRGRAREFDAFHRAIMTGNRVLWRAALPIAMLLLLLPWRLTGPGWWLGLYFRAGFCCIAAQAFVSDSGPRYYVILIPLVAATLGVAASAPGSSRRLGAPLRRHGTAFRCLEWTMPAAIALALAAVLVLGYL